jgi:hypothetical protein
MNASAARESVNEVSADWIGGWTALETRLAALLAAPRRYADWPHQLELLLAEARARLALDEDMTLYWLLQINASTTVGYSAAHAMFCWTLCRLLAPAIGLSAEDGEALERAALSMNIGMTRLQDTLASQSMPPTIRQRALIDTHAARGAQWLRECGVRHPRWLDIVEQHHESLSDDLAIRVLQRVDRYAALWSPRQTRRGIDGARAARVALIDHQGMVDAIGRTLVTTLGISPPGTFVRLFDGRIGIVLRRGKAPDEPWVGVVLDGDGSPLLEPELIDTGAETSAVEASVCADEARVRLDHTRLLELSRQARMHQHGH